MPWAIGGGLVAYRKSWLHEVGFDKFPDTWDELHRRQEIEGRATLIGQTAGHTFGDAPGWWYPYLWSWGGKEVEADGKTVALNTPETVESVKFAVALWKEAMDEGGLAWDDSSNNRAFLSGSIAATNNGASIYLEAKKKPDTYQTEKGEPMCKDISHAPIPKGTGGQFNVPGPFTDMVMGYSKNQKMAKEFLSWVHSKPVFEQWFTSQQGYTAGATKDLRERSGVEQGPGAGAVPRDSRDRAPGRLCRAAEPKAAEVRTKYIIVDMYAKAIQGMAAEDSVKWAT